MSTKYVILKTDTTNNNTCHTYSTSMDQSQILYESSTINSCKSQWNIDHPNNQFPQYWYIKYNVTAGQWSCIPTYTTDNIMYYNDLKSCNQTSRIYTDLLNK